MECGSPVYPEEQRAATFCLSFFSDPKAMSLRQPQRAHRRPLWPPRAKDNTWRRAERHSATVGSAGALAPLNSAQQEWLCCYAPKTASLCCLL